MAAGKRIDSTRNAQVTTVEGTTRRDGRKDKGPGISAGALFLPFGRRDWTRTNDPHHVKVVL